jgi:Asp-tRNA(Asn)/Glu-tRNA(Gln) amidotransferase A subunit family amidase
VSAAEAVQRALAVVADRDAVVQAWAFLDPDRALAEARAVDDGRGGPLRGLVIGVKDIIDTGDQPTQHGSPIYAGNRPGRDAACVALVRAAGAVCIGKTVTAELACFHPGPTTNPHRPTHTPGGSSMGSAAAAATGMVDVALGTQTAGSVTRPASFCGVFGFKPTFGLVSRDGVKLIAPSLDTVGLLARSADALDEVRVVLTGGAPAERVTAPALGLLRTEHWGEASADSRRAVEEAARRARLAHARVVDVAMEAPFRGLAAAQSVVQPYEAARHLAWELREHRPALSDDLAALLERGAAIGVRDYEAARAHAAAARASLDSLFGDVDVLLTPAVIGEAPEGLGSTGDPLFARAWTILGLPTLSVPGLVGSSGLPVGVQLVGRPNADAAVMGAGAWLGDLLEGC